MSRLLFYLRYAFRNLRRSGRWSIFAVFCIAAGVATVVALRSLGLAIADSLVDNVRASNHGDITISVGGGGGLFSSLNFVNPDNEENGFSDEQVARALAWVEEQGGQATAYINYGNMQVTRVDQTRVGRPQFVSAFLIDPQTFPPTGDILTSDPPRVPLRELLTSDNDIVISRNLADTEGISVGDTVRVSGTEEPFTVRGIVPTETEANLRNLFASFFGFAYLDISHAEKLQISPNPNAISLTLPPGSDLVAAENTLRQAGVFGRYTNVQELLEANTVIGDYVGRFIVIMGLGALLIGGVGIINTMLVMVGRRTVEIAALKTFGLKGRQVAALFLAEAFLLGIAGSVVGCILGVALSAAVNQYGEAFLQQRLTWRLYPEALLYGLGLGMIVTMVFGVTPVLTAVRIRPAIIMRPNEPQVTGVGCLQALVGILLVILVIGTVAGQILGVVWVGIVGVAAALLIMALLVALLWVVVWVVSKLPAFGWVDLRPALRNLTARRVRTATTLLALSAGMFALSSITFVGAGTREILNFQLTESMGGNVLVFPYASLLSPEIGQAVLEFQLMGIEGIERVRLLETYELRLRAVNGEPPEIVLPLGMSEENLPPRARRELRDISLAVSVADLENPNPNAQVRVGRNLTPEDRGKPVIVLSAANRLATVDMGVGSILTLGVGSRTVDFEVVGILDSASTLSMASSGSLVPPDVLGDLAPEFALTVLQVRDDKLNDVLLALSALVPPVLAIDITFIDGLVTRLIDQFSSIPTLVGLLSLLAAAVIMANTVSLATLERRRQIGILKAVGLKGRRVLWVMLLENTLVGLLGGLIGIGLSALMVAIMTAFGVGDAIPIPRDATTAAVALIVASVVIAWIATFASARVAISERVTNVLRYE